MSVRQRLRRFPSESDGRLLSGVGVLLAASFLLTLVTVRPENTPLGVLRAVVGVVFVTLVPGYLLRKVFSIRAPSTAHAVLDSVGLSVLFCVVVATLFDTLLAGVAGIGGSLTGITFSVILVASVSLMVGVVIRREEWKPLRQYRSVVPRRRDWPEIALLTEIPILAVVGAHFVNQSNANHVALAFVLLVAAVPLVLRAGFVSNYLEPYAVFCTALGVLYHTALISPHVWGWDVHYEYNAALRFLELGHWESASGNYLSSLLTVTLLSGIYSEVTGLPLAWVFKAVFPLLFALMPVGIYCVSKRVFEDRAVAILAPFFAVFYYGFFKVLPGKQAFAEIFVVLFLLAALARSKRVVLAVCFLGALVFSHYATSLLFLLFFGATVVGLTAFKRVADVTNPGGFTIVRPVFVVALGLMWVSWYSVTADGIVVDRVVSTARVAVQQLFVQSSERSGIAYASQSYGSPLWTLHKAIYVVVIGLSGLGVLREVRSLYRRRTIDARGEYAVVGAGVCAFLASSAVMTYNMGFDRVLQISLVVLAPLAVLGARWPVELLAERGVRSTVLSRQTATTAVTVFLAVMFVFSSGAAFAFAGQDVPAYSIGLDKDAGFPVYTESEVAATRWVDDNLPVCADIGVYSDRARANSRDGLLLSEVVPGENLRPVPPRRPTAARTTYMYVSDRPLDESDDIGAYIDPNATRYHENILSDAEVVYSRDNVRVYRLDGRPVCPSTGDDTGATGEKIIRDTGVRGSRVAA